MADQGAVHLCTEGSLHGKDLFSRKSRLCAGIKALPGGKYAGRNPGRIAQCPGKAGEFLAARRHQNAAGKG